MAAEGEIEPMPDCAIFADTGWELEAVYQHLRWLRSPNVLPFPVHVVSAGNICADLLQAGSGERWASIPTFTRTVVGARVDVGMIRRQCTKDYKIVPIRRKVRELAGLTRRRSPKAPVVEQWIGISLDEAIRIKPSFETWRVNRWPLIEQRMTRRDCIAWLKRHDYPIPPKSSCIGCRSIPTPCGGACAITIHPPGRTRWRSIGSFAPACAASGARSISTARPCRSTRPI